MNQGSTYNVRTALKLSNSGPADLFAVISIDAFTEHVKVSVQHEVRFNDPAEPDESIVRDVSEQVIPWGDLASMETLAEIFCSQRVDVFGTIVEMLGRIHRQRTAILSLVGA